MERLKKRTTILFVIWFILVLIIVGLLTTLGFMLNNKYQDYEQLESKLLKAAQEYTLVNKNDFEGAKDYKLTSEVLIASDYMDELKLDDEVCEGYVLINHSKEFSYKVFIKCENYTSSNYEN